MENVYASRIGSLRSMMRSKGWDAVVITGSDPHASEYPAGRWKQVAFLTGFTGEAGDVVVTLDHAGLWTDTRYFIQALSQLDGTGVELHKTRVPDEELIPEWLGRKFAGEEIVIAVDGLAIAASWVEDTASQLCESGVEASFVSVPDLLSPLWPDRPGVPQTPVFTVETGESREEKLAFLRDAAHSKGCDALLLSALDDIAWALNVRASDIEYNPFVISYLLVGDDECVWYVLKDRVEDPQTEAAFASLEGVRLESYEAAADLLREDCEGCRLLVDASSLNYDLYSSLAAEGVDLVPADSPAQRRKAVKNAFEISSLRAAHVRDGVAVEKFLYWLEKSLAADRVVTEWDAAVRLGRFRAEIEGYLGDSFETISACGPGGALPHYITPKKDAPVLEQHGLYLCDSGGQFYGPSEEIGGTTDITRTVPLGECSELEREDYTLVLKGHIGLAMAVFPAGTPGCRVDALAREPLWRFRRNFGHGTGHGVGYILGCHEGPQDVRQNMNSQPLMPGMVVSDEPGIYREGLHGVRHENLLLVVEDSSNEFGDWLRFEPLTLCHFDTSILRTDLLTREEIDWLNGYNERVFNTLSPLLDEDEAEWLKGKTRKIAYVL